MNPHRQTATYRDMTSTQQIRAKIQTLDAKDASERRFRNILANSGELMESGEIRDLDQLYVMDYDGKLIKVTDLDKNPDNQKEHYAVKAQADHGEVIDGMLIPSIEKQFGSCKVWLEEDGLHARMYFADNDSLADHAWAISQDASYSIGIDWFPEGYNGVGYEIDQPIGILREISMVITGNDPRAKTIDHKPTEAEAQRSADVASDAPIKENNGEPSEMKKTLDELTQDERDAMSRELLDIVEKFTANVPEDETEPTADDAPEATPVEAEAEAEEPAQEPEAEAEEKEEEKEKDVKENTTDSNMPVLVVRDSVEQPAIEKKADWIHSAEAHRAFADTLKKAGRMNATFDAMWKAEASKHMSLDGISGLPNPAPVDQMFVNALEKSTGIISHFQFINAKSFRIHIMESESRAAGHKKGDTKANQSVTDTVRDLLVKMVYKRLDLDATELYENPFLIDFRSQELVDAIIAEIERAAIIGDGRTYTSGADYRMFDGTRGFYSVKADAAANSGAGNAFASTYTSAEGANLYDGVVGARELIVKEGAQILVAKKSAITALLQAKVSGGYLIQPGAKVEDVLGVSAIYTPNWMASETNDAYLIVDKAYKHGGENGIRVRAEFDTATNTDVLLDETPRFGSLGEEKSAVAIVLTPAD